MVAHTWHNQKFWLSPQRFMFWENAQTIIVSDLHLGKTGHFRKEGIAVPQAIYQQDLLRLFDGLGYYQPRRVIIVGDLFHSEANLEMNWFSRWRADLAQVDFLLVQGNHDILKNQWYADNGIHVQPILDEAGLRFTHEPPASSKTDLPEQTFGIVSGHIHPAISFQGAGRQSLRLPCFFFSDTQCILPAFGHFTGTFTLKPKKKDAVYAVTPTEVIKVC